MVFSTIYTAVLSATFGYVVKKLRWIAENPCCTLSKLKENSGPDRIFNDEEIRSLIDACKQSKSSLLYPIVLFALTTGARRGEILKLEWRQVHFEKGIAFLAETKNGRPRSVALSDSIIAKLKTLYHLRNPTPVCVGGKDCCKRCGRKLLSDCPRIAEFNERGTR